MATLDFRAEYQARVQQVVTYISSHLAEPLDLQTLAGISHFSPYHFHRIFTAVTDETPQDMVNRLRLEKAANMLIKSPLSITEIAFNCGFSSSATFARSFKKHFGLAASEYARRGLEQYPGSAHAKGETDFSPPELRISFMPGLHLAYIADMKGYSLPDICRSWERLFRWASAHELLNNDTRVVGISYDDPLITPADKCRFYACVSVPADVCPDRLVGTLDIPASRCAVFRAQVRPEQIYLIYRYFYRDWLPDSGLQPADFPAYEIYYETPDTNPEGKFLMEVCVPVLPL